jgi:hypothetical protein
MRVNVLVCALALCLSAAVTAAGQQFDLPAPVVGNISSTVTDLENDIVPGATVALDGPANTGVDVAANVAMSVLEEFVLRRVTSGAGGKTQ